MADSVIHGDGASAGGTLQEYIGYPGAIDDKGSTSISDLYKKDLDEKIVVATITPMMQSINKDANIYNPVPAWGKYTSDLQKNCAVSVGSGVSGCLKVVISQFPPVTETYVNQYGDSEILQSANMIGGKAAELMQIVGAHDTKELEDMAQKAGENSAFFKLVKEALAGYNAGAKALERYGESNSGIGAKAAGAVGNIMQKPWSKIGWPQMWQNCSYQSTYELSTRLYCYNVTDDAEYNNNIKAALAALQLFVAPKSEDGVLYTWPYMMQFEIPGSVYMPIAYCSNMTVVKGGDVADFSFTGRPNIIDVRMTIQNAYGICVSMPIAKESLVPARPTLYKDQKALSAGRNIGISPASSGGGGGSSSSSSSASSSGQNLTASNLSNSALSYVRSNTTAEQKAAITKLAAAGATASGGPVAGAAASAAASAVLGS